MRFEGNPFGGGLMETAERVARSKVLAGLLMLSAAPSLEACVGGVTLGRGPLSSIHEGERPEKEPGLPDYESMLAELKQAFGDDAISTALRAHQVYAEKERTNSIPTISGFEQHLSIGRADVAEQLTQYPRGWVSHVSEIKLNPHYHPINYPGLEGKAEYGHCSRDVGQGIVRIEFTHKNLEAGQKPGASAVLNIFTDSMTHELAHANDWVSNHKLDAKQSLQLMYMVYKASSDPERPKYDYPESIKSKNQARQKDVAYDKATEYFAELVTTALDTHGANSWETWSSVFVTDLKQKKASDRAAWENARMVRIYLSWNDPSFKPWEFANGTRERTDKMVTKQWEKRIAEGLEGLDDPMLKMALITSMRQKISSKEDAHYQHTRLTGMDFTKDGRYAKTKNYLSEVEPAVRQEFFDIISEFNSVAEAVLGVRNGLSDFRTYENGQSALVDMGSGTLGSFVETYKHLDEAQKAKVKEILLIGISALNETSPLEKETHVARK